MYYQCPIKMTTFPDIYITLLFSKFTFTLIFLFQYLFSVYNFGHIIFLSNTHIYLHTVTLMLIFRQFSLFFAIFLPVCHLSWVVCGLSHLCKSQDCLCSRLSISRIFAQRIILKGRDWEREPCLLFSMIKIMSLFGVIGRMLTAHYKIFGFPKLSMQPVIHSLHVQELSDIFCITVWFGLGKLVQENANTLATAIAIIKSLLSDSGMSCLLMAFMKPWHAYWLACKQIFRLSDF